MGAMSQCSEWVKSHVGTVGGRGAATYCKVERRLHAQGLKRSMWGCVSVTTSAAIEGKGRGRHGAEGHQGRLRNWRRKAVSTVFMAIEEADADGNQPTLAA